VSCLFNEIEQLIDELIETIGKIRQNRETNISAVKEQNILVESEIRELRRKIDKRLDQLVFVIFQYANSATRTLMFFTV
jgi:predicted  nucleic acid-binding Zn-ribbon protein